MDYQAFARKWRPKKFSDIIGQDHVMQVIMHSFNLNKIHHAYLLSGMRGIGKTTIGRLFAKGLNCKNGPTTYICGECKNCQSIESGCFIDLIEIDAASKTKVEDTREILDNIHYFPSIGRYKVYVIDEVHMLSRHSFNALLKTLEEPPEHVKFILITTEYNKLPETILSRCMRFHLKPLSISEILKGLIYVCNKEHISIAEHALELIAHASQGSMRDALNLLEKAMLLNKNLITVDNVNNMLGILSTEHSLFFIESLLNNDVNSIMCKINSLSELGIDWDHLFNDILTIFQKIAVYQFSSGSFQKNIHSNHEKCINQRIYNLGNRITPENVQLYYQIFLLGRKELPFSPSYRMGMEMTMLRAIAFYPVDTKLKKCYQNVNTNFHDFNKNSIKKNSNNLNNPSPVQHSFTSKQPLKDVLNYKNNSQNTRIYKNIYEYNKIDLCPDKTIYNENNHIISYKDNCTVTMPYKTVSNITASILDARSKLVEYKKNKTKTSLQSNTNVESKKISEKIFERFLHINTKNEIKKKQKI